MTHTCHFHGNRDSLQTTKLSNKDSPPSDLFPHNSTQGSKLFNQQPRRSSFEKADTQTQHLHRTPSIFPGTQAGFLFFSLHIAACVIRKPLRSSCKKLFIELAAWVSHQIARAGFPCTDSASPSPSKSFLGHLAHV